MIRYLFFFFSLYGFSFDIMLIQDINTEVLYEIPNILYADDIGEGPSRTRGDKGENPPSDWMDDMITWPSSESENELEESREENYQGKGKGKVDSSPTVPSSNQDYSQFGKDTSQSNKDTFGTSNNPIDIDRENTSESTESKEDFYYKAKKLNKEIPELFSDDEGSPNRIIPRKGAKAPDYLKSLDITSLRNEVRFAKRKLNRILSDSRKDYEVKNSAYEDYSSKLTSLRKILKEKYGIDYDKYRDYEKHAPRVSMFNLDHDLIKRILLNKESPKYSSNNKRGASPSSNPSSSKKQKK